MLEWGASIVRVASQAAQGGLRGDTDDRDAPLSI